MLNYQRVSSVLCCVDCWQFGTEVERSKPFWIECPWGGARLSDVELQCVMVVQGNHWCYHRCDRAIPLGFSECGLEHQPPQFSTSLSSVSLWLWSLYDHYMLIISGRNTSNCNQSSEQKQHLGRPGSSGNWDMVCLFSSRNFSIGVPQKMCICIWFVVYLPIWKIWKSVGMIIPNIWKMFQTTKQHFQPKSWC